MAIIFPRPWMSSQHRFLNSISNIHSTKLFSVAKRKSLVCCAPSPPDSDSPPVPWPVLSLSVGAHLIPHPNKVTITTLEVEIYCMHQLYTANVNAKVVISKLEKGGEDAFFFSSSNGGVIAVADGVSGWAEQNVDPALFSRELMAKASTLVDDDEVNYDPQILIKKAHAANSSIGSATVIVAMLEKSGILKVASVGDCGLRVIRQGQIVFSTCQQEHYFDCPYQLSSEAVGQTYLDAAVRNVELVEGDTIVMGSDGLFDNVFDREIISTVATCANVADAAKALAELAHNHSKDSNFDSPYSQEARTQGIEVPWWKKILGMKLTGGKLDDITVIVGQVKNS